MIMDCEKHDDSISRIFVNGVVQHIILYMRVGVSFVGADGVCFGEHYRTFTVCMCGFFVA